MNIVQDRLYEHIYALQGVRHPVTGYDALCRARDYIAAQLEPLCDAVTVEPFTVSGCNRVFHNIDARIGGPENGPALLLGCHYDTVWQSPGADDNASGVAAVLELARLFAPMRNKVHLRLLAFSLEECDPVYEQLMLRKAAERGVRGADGSYTKLEYLTQARDFRRALDTAEGSYGERYRLALASCGLCPELRELHQAAAARYAGCADTLGFGSIGLLGSHHWVAEHRAELQACRGLINYDSIGFCAKKPHSHARLDAMRYALKTWEVDFEKQAGDFIVAVSNESDGALTGAFCRGCRAENLPYALAEQPYTYEQTALGFPAALQSDHAAFWREDVPVLFLTDTGAEMRNHFEHTHADTIDKIDFAFAESVVLAARHTVAELFGL